MFRTALDRAIVGPSSAARTSAGLGLAAYILATPGPGARRGRVISPSTPQPPELDGELPVYDDGVLRITRIPGRVRGPGVDRSPGPRPGTGYALAGEIDESTVRGLAGKLAELAAGAAEVHLDLAAVDYCDLAGLRVIVQLAADGRRRVVLHRVPPHLRVILGIVGWDTAPGVELAS